MSYTPPQSRGFEPTVTTGFSYTIPDTATIVAFQSTGVLLSGTITLPANPNDGQPLTLESVKGITSATVQANIGQTLISGLNISTMTAITPYRLKYMAVSKTWYPN